MSDFRSRSPESLRFARARFLAALAETGSVRCAAETSGRTRAFWLARRERNAAFARAWDEALESYVELLEAEADRRALTGDSEPVFFGGKRVGERPRVSDNLLMFRLKALRPGRYRGTMPEADDGVVVEVRDFSGKAGSD